MTFETEKQKLFKLYSNSASNTFIIDTLSSNDKIIFNRTENLNNTNTVYNNILNLNSDWLEPNFITLKNDTDYILNMFKEFEVIFKGLNKTLIPYIDAKISYRVGTGEISSPIPLSEGGDEPFDEDLDGFEINSVVEISKIVDVFKRDIIYRTSIFLREGSSIGLPADLQFKFYINLINPNYYQST